MYLLRTKSYAQKMIKMSTLTDYVLGIDLGSSRLTGSLGRRSPDGHTTLLSIISQPIDSEIRRGVIHNVEEIAKDIQQLTQKLLQRESATIKAIKVYVNLNAYSLRTIDAKSSFVFSEEEILEESMLEELRLDALTQIDEKFETLDVYDQEYMADGKVDLRPVGALAKVIEGRYRVAVVRKELLRSLDACFKRLDVDYERILGPSAAAAAALTEEEKMRGVVLLDFGAQTTSISVYKSGILRHMAVLPFGGNSITRDLTQLNKDWSDLEAYKLEKGTAKHYTEWAQDESRREEFARLEDFDKTANEIVVARMEEIIDNILAQITYSGIDVAKLAEGIVMVGAASDLKDLSGLLEKKITLTVRQPNLRQHFYKIENGLELNASDAVAAGLLLLASPDCCKVVEKTIPDRTKLDQEPLISGFETVDTTFVEPAKKEKPTEPAQKPRKKSSLFGGWARLFDDEDL